MKKRVLALWLLFACGLLCWSQKPPKSEAGDRAKDIDPLALKVLKAATDPLREAKAFSFRALVSREDIGTNGQVVTLFNLSDVALQRPDKLHVNYRGRGKKVQLFYNAGTCLLYTPEEKLYTSIPCSKTIDASLDDLDKRNVFIPIRNFLGSDPYQSLTDNLVTAYVIGQVMLFDEPVHQLAFTEPKAEWQLWVVGGDRPRIRRLQVVDKTKPWHPRMTVDFVDWDLNAIPAPDLFTFNKPPDAKEIGLLQEHTRK
jgi:hypothetical protein